jgi:GntR family transcriptional regulator/MocR family aminotransferase
MPLRRVPEQWIRLDGEGALWGQLYRALRQAVLAGDLAAGARVPSTRTLAREVGVSRSTVLPVYDQLLCEGYFVARHGSGTFVASGVAEGRPAARRRRRARRARVSARGQRLLGLPYPYDALARAAPAPFELLYGMPEAEAFPRADWRRLAARRIRRAALPSLAYSAPEGVPELREAIAAHLGRTRGVRCTADRVLVVTGAQQALQLVSEVLLDAGDAVVLEEPHYLGARTAFQAAGATIVTAPVDDEGIDMQRVAASAAARARLVYVTPSHQFPLGATLSLRRRLELLRWAGAHGAYVLEDDYDSEYRWSERPVEALASLDDEGRVVYVGTFSKVLFPGLRVGYVVPPEELLAPLRSAKWIADWCTPTLDQLVLADFMAEGSFDRHLRRMRARYGRRRALLREALSSALGRDVRLAAPDAGLHLCAWLGGVPARRTAALVSEARRRGVGVYPIAPHYLGRPPPEAGLVLGYTLVDDDGIRESAARLAAAVRATSGRAPRR